MYHAIKNFRFLAIAFTALLLCATGADAAGLIGYRNDTNQAVVVQSSVTSNGRTSLSKPQTLYPGEVALDNVAFVGTRKITVYDAKNAKVVLFQGEVTNSDDAFYSVAAKAATVAIKGQKPAEPSYELVKVQAPVMPKPGKPAPPTTPPIKKK